MPTIKDVAAMAGVSVATVSHVINHTRYVSPALDEKVRLAMSDLHYIPSEQARVSVAAKTKTIGLIGPRDPNEFFDLFGVVARQMQGLATRQPHTQLLLIPTDPKKEITASLLRNFQKHYNLDGIVAIACRVGRSFADSYSPKVSTVFVAPQGDVGAAVRLNLDYIGALSMALKHLLKRGHDSVAVLAPHDGAELFPRLEQETRRVLEKYGVLYRENTVISMANGMEQQLEILFSQLPDLTAVVACSPKLGLALMARAHRRRIRIPEDLSVVCLGGLPSLPLAGPSLTHVSFDLTQLAQKCFDCLMGKEELKVYTAGCTFAARESSIAIARGPFGEKAASADVLMLTSSEIELLRRKNYSVGVSFHQPGTMWMQLHERGIRDSLASVGVRLLAVTCAHFDPHLQCIQHDSLLSMNPDAIISIPVDDIRTTESYLKIVRSGVKLVLITNIPQGLTRDDYAACVSVNEMENGRLAGRILGKHMTKTNRVHYGMINHGAAFFATRQRDLSAEGTLLDEFPSLHLAGKCSFHKIDNVSTVTRQLLTEHPEIQSLYVCWEEPARQVLRVLHELGRKDITIVTTDLDHEVAHNIAEGGNIVGLSSQRYYDQGYTMGLAVANALLGKPMPSFIGVSPYGVTRSNLQRAWNHLLKEKPPEPLFPIQYSGAPSAMKSAAPIVPKPDSGEKRRTP